VSPIWNDPPRRLLDAFRRARREQGDREAAKLTVEQIQAVLDPAGYLVRGVVVPMTGQGPKLRAGDYASVAWRRGVPVAVIDHAARRAQPPPEPVRPAGGVLEELFVGVPAGGTTREVYFRNYDHVASLNLFALTGRRYSTVRWGLNDNAFLAFDGTRFLDVFTLARAKGRIQPSNATPKAALLKAYDLLDGTIPLATLVVVFTGSFSGHPNPTTDTYSVVNSPTFTGGGVPVLNYSQPSGPLAANIQYLALNASNELIVVWVMTLASFVASPPGGQISLNFSWPLVVNHAAKALLFDSFSDQTLVSTPLGAPAPLAPNFNGTDWSTIPTSGAGAARISANFYPQYSAAEPRMDERNRIESMFAEAVYEQMPIIGGSSSPVDRYASAVLHPSGRFASTTVRALTASASRALARTGLLTNGPAMEPAGLMHNRHHCGFFNQLDFSPTEDFIASYDLNQVFDVGPDSAAGPAGLVMLAPDLIYALPDEAGAKDRFFVRAWTGAGKVTLTTGAPKFPPEDTALASAKALADIPAKKVALAGGVVNAFHVVNESDILAPLGRFRAS
jgi:hypothetical protein